MAFFFLHQFVVRDHLCNHMHGWKELSQATLVVLGHQFILLNCDHSDQDKGYKWLNKMNFFLPMLTSLMLLLLSGYTIKSKDQHWALVWHHSLGRLAPLLGFHQGYFIIEGTKFFFIWIDTYYVYGFVFPAYIPPVNTIYLHGNCHTKTIWQGAHLTTKWLKQLDPGLIKIGFTEDSGVLAEKTSSIEKDLFYKIEYMLWISGYYMVSP